MFKTLRTLGIAAAVAAALPAQAALTPVKLDFNLTAGPIAAGNAGPYAGDSFGNTTFTGNTAYIEDQGGANQGVLDYGCNALVTTCTPEDQLVISVGSLFTGTLAFDYNVGQPMVLTVLLASGGSMTQGFSTPGWNHFSLDLTGVWASGIIFDVTPGTAKIDNLEFEIDVATPTVPEPASLALVALALAGAGSVLRRKPR